MKSPPPPPPPARSSRRDAGQGATAGLWQGMPAAGPGAVLPGAVHSFRRLSLACGAAIAAIAILAISGHLALQGILASHAEASALAALGHSQHDLTHLVGDEAIALAGEPDPARRLALATALAGRLTTWHDQHATLGDGENDVITGEEWDRGVPPLADVTPEFEAISRAVRDVLVTAGTDGVTVVGSGDAPLDIARIGAEQAAYLAGVGAASEAFHARAVRRLDDLRGMEGGLALLTLSVLAVIAVLTFGPATRGLRRFSSKLGRAETEAHQLGDILAASSDGIVGLSLDGRIVSWNGGAEAVYGRSGRETIGMPVADLVQDAGAASADPLLSALDALRGGRGPAGPVRFEGRAINVSCAVSPLRDATGTVIGMALVTRDETEANLLRGQILFRALHDPLTETPNRTLFRDRLHQAVARATRRGTLVGVLIIDIDAFRFVNDRHGHEVGNGLLKAVALRVGSLLRSGDTVARVSGDQFAVLLDDLADGVAAEDVSSQVMTAFSEPFVVEGHPLTVSTSIGVALSRAESALGTPGTMVQPDDLIHDAEAALASAKRGGKGAVVVFERALITRARSRLQ